MFALHPSAPTASPLAHELIERAGRAGTPPRTLALACVAVARLIPSAPQVVVDVLDAVEAWARGEATEWEIEAEMGALRAAFRLCPSPALSAAEYTAALAAVSTLGGAAAVAADAVHYAVDAGVVEREAARVVLAWVVGGEGQVAA